MNLGFRNCYGFPPDKSIRCPKLFKADRGFLDNAPVAAATIAMNKGMKHKQDKGTSFNVLQLIHTEDGNSTCGAVMEPEAAVSMKQPAASFIASSTLPSSPSDGADSPNKEK